MNYCNFNITGFEKEFKLPVDSPCILDINDNKSIDAYLKKYYRMYVISNKMQNQILRKNYTIY